MTKIYIKDTAPGLSSDIQIPPLVEIRKGVKNTSDRNSPILNSINLSLHRGERLAVVGPTGSGKTVLLRCIALLDPLDDGLLLWQGNTVNNKKIPKYRKEVIYIHQHPVLFEGTVLSNIRMPFSLHSNASIEFDLSLVKEILRDIGFGDSFLSRSHRDLSGGERQVVAIIRAIQLKPTVILLDEPTSALDQKTTAAVENLVMKWKEEKQNERGYIWVSHSPDQVSRITQRQLKIEKGRITGEKV